MDENNFFQLSNSKADLVVGPEVGYLQIMSMLEQRSERSSSRNNIMAQPLASSADLVDRTSSQSHVDRFAIAQTNTTENTGTYNTDNFEIPHQTNNILQSHNENVVSSSHQSLPANFKNNLLECTSEAENLRQFSFKRRTDTELKNKKKKSRGPPPSTVKVKPYHLPPCSSKPKFNIFDDITVSTHTANGYGYPKACYDIDNKKIRFMSMPIESDIHDELSKIFSNLEPTYHIYKLDKRSGYKSWPIKQTAELRSTTGKSKCYQGVLVISSNPNLAKSNLPQEAPTILNLPKPTPKSNLPQKAPTILNLPKPTPKSNLPQNTIHKASAFKIKPKTDTVHTLFNVSLENHNANNLPLIPETLIDDNDNDDERRQILEKLGLCNFTCHDMEAFVKRNNLSVGCLEVEPDIIRMEMILAKFPGLFTERPISPFAVRPNVTAQRIRSLWDKAEELPEVYSNFQEQNQVDIDDLDQMLIYEVSSKEDFLLFTAIMRTYNLTLRVQMDNEVTPVDFENE